MRVQTCCRAHKDEGEGEGGRRCVMMRVTTTTLLSSSSCCQTHEEEGQDSGQGGVVGRTRTRVRAVACDGKGYDNDVVGHARTRIRARRCCRPHEDEGEGEGG